MNPLKLSAHLNKHVFTCENRNKCYICIKIEIMFFEIDFNKGRDDRVIELLGATQSEREGFVHYKVNIDTFEELEELLNVVDDLKNDYYSAVISFDPPTIFLDKDV